MLRHVRLENLFKMILFLQSCQTIESTNSQPLLLRQEYLNTLGFDENGSQFIGVVTLSDKPCYNFRFKKKEADFLKIWNCHRHIVQTDLSSTIKYTYCPTSYELETHCPLRFALLDEKGEHRWATIDFVQGRKLQAKVTCNGALEEVLGTTWCQCFIGRKEGITFLEPVDYVTVEPNRCSDLSKQGNAYSLNISKGECIYLFKNKAGQEFKFVTYGYNDFIQRVGD